MTLVAVVLTMQLAAIGGHEEFVRALLAGGADPTIETNHGGRASAFAVAFGFPAVAALLKA